MKLNRYETSRLHLALVVVALADKLADRLGLAFKSRKAVQPLQSDESDMRLAAVAQYMDGQARSLRLAWEATAEFDNPALKGEEAMLAAGAAAAEAMSRLLFAILNGDKEFAKATLREFVNDAVDGGVVTV